MIKSTPKTLEELKNLRKPVRNVNAEHREKLTKLEKLALLITQRVGTMGFFLIILVWTASWLLWNSIGPVSSRFDPFPAFVLWLFISNMIQIMPRTHLRSIFGRDTSQFRLTQGARAKVYL